MPRRLAEVSQICKPWHRQDNEIGSLMTILLLGSKKSNDYGVL